MVPAAPEFNPAVTESCAVVQAERVGWVDDVVELGGAVVVVVVVVVDEVATGLPLLQPANTTATIASEAHTPWRCIRESLCFMVVPPVPTVSAG